MEISFVKVLLLLKFVVVLMSFTDIFYYFGSLKLGLISLMREDIKQKGRRRTRVMSEKL